MLQNSNWRQQDHQHRKQGGLTSKWVKGIQEPYGKKKQNKTKKPHCPRNSEWQKPSASIFTLARQKWVADPRQWGVFFIPLCCKKKFSEHFVGKKSLTQETRINRHCNNPCYKWDERSLPPSQGRFLDLKILQGLVYKPCHKDYRKSSAM